MQHWNQGYVTDIVYTKGYYGTLNPLRIKLCFLAQKLLPPKINTACELGFGQGITLNFNAASMNATWYGTDFNPSQASYAKHLANISGAPLQIFDDSFGEFLSRKDLPQFDFIALHGIYSWVSPQVREQILEFISSKLSLGGGLLISYNCQAGWSSMEPFRALLHAYSNYFSPLSKPSSNRIQESLEFVDSLMSLPCSETLKSHKLESIFATLNKMDSTYLAHELLNKEHRPFNFLEISKDLEQAKLSFASYANYSDHLINIQFSDDEKKLLSQVAHNRPIYEMLKDLMFATSFRSDYWAKGIVPLSQEEAYEELLKLEIVLIVPHGKIDYEIKTYRGTFQLNQDFYSPLLQILSDNQPKCVRELRDALSSSLKREINFSEMLESLIALSNKNYVKLVQNQSRIQEAKFYTQKLNSHILKRSIQSQGYINHLISPVTAEAIPLNRFELMLLYASTLFKEKERWVEFVLQTIHTQGESILKDGKELSKEETKKELENQVKNLTEWIPILQKLQIL